MAQQFSTAPVLRRRFSLPTYISILLAITAILPLLAMVGSIAIFLRPALINQVSGDMERDAQTRVQLIDTYFAERFNDIKTLSNSDPIKRLLTGDQNAKTMVQDILFTAQHRDVANYISLSLLDAQGNVAQSYPAAPLHHGKYNIVPGALDQLQKSGKVLISDVFYDQIGNNASVDLYSRVINDNFQLLGVVRISLGLHRIWEPVDAEVQSNGAGSYATIVDQHGVRIAYTNLDHSGFTHSPYLFKSVAPISPTFMQRIQDEDLYGNSSVAVKAAPDQTLADIQSNAQSPNVFQINPVELNQTFEAARYTSQIVPWTYIIFKPLNVVTGIADQQLFSLILIVGLGVIIAVVVGLTAGRGIALPILRSVTSLSRNSRALKTLSDEEHVVATEQSWMIEASQIALKSVKYYTNATGVAAQRISMLGNEAMQTSRSFDARRIYTALEEMMESAEYIKRAVKHQEEMNERLSTSLNVTTQATEQLTRGAKSTDDAATQLEQIVGQLTAVVGELKTSRPGEEQ